MQNYSMVGGGNTEYYFVKDNKKVENVDDNFFF
jgi:hypothetical protein